MQKQNIVKCSLPAEMETDWAMSTREISVRISQELATILQKFGCLRNDLQGSSFKLFPKSQNIILPVAASPIEARPLVARAPLSYIPSQASSCCPVRIATVAEAPLATLN